MNYKKQKLSVTLPLEIYIEIKQSALGTDWTEKEILAWSLSLGVEEIDNVDNIEKEIAKQNIRKSKLNSELEGVTKDYIKFSSRNAALTYECFDTFSNNKTLTFKLTGAKAKKRSFNNALKATNEAHDKQVEREDSKMVEKYVLNRVNED